jgi:hypothetical protein
VIDDAENACSRADLRMHFQDGLSKAAPTVESQQPEDIQA